MECFFVRRRAIWTMAILMAAAGCGDDGTGPGPVMTGSVTVIDNEFQPASITVAPGATVTWTWSGTSEEHNVTFSNAGISSSALQSSGTHTATMPTAPGTYEYLCTRHVGMEGSVQVVP